MKKWLSKQMLMKIIESLGNHLKTYILIFFHDKTPEETRNRRNTLHHKKDTLTN
jgi:hypothetical protein